MTFNTRSCFLLIPLLLMGCGGEDRPPLAKASGIVKLDGAPVEGATVTYLPVDGGRPGTGQTDAQGRYTIKTFEDAEGAIVGDHKVAVMKVSGEGADVLDEGGAPSGDVSDEDDGSDGLSMVMDTEENSNGNPQITYDVPEMYMDSNNSGLRITVPAEGSETLDLELSKQE